MEITVNDLNEAPTNLVVVPAYIDENQPAGTVVGQLKSTDPSLIAPLTYGLITSAEGPDNRFFATQGDQLITTSVLDFEQRDPTYTILVRVTDSNGLFRDAPLQITVNDVNEAPVAKDHRYTADQYTQLVVEAPGLLEGASDPEGDFLTAVLVPDKGPQHGSLLLDPDGSFVYEPNDDFVGTDEFQYQAFDGQSYSDSATVTITMLDEAPTADSVEYTIIQNTQLTVAAPGLLAYASDPDGNPLTLDTTPYSGPEHGTVSLSSDGSFFYQPNSNYIGSDEFTYRAFDGELYSAPAVVKITVVYDPDPVVQAPTLVIGANNLALTRVEDNIVLVSFANRQVLLNQPASTLNSITVVGADNRADTLTIDSSVSGVLSGGVTFNGGSGHLADTLVLRGSSGADALGVTPDYAAVNLLVVPFSNVEQLVLEGGGGDDTYWIPALPVNTTIADSNGNDWVDFSGAASGARIDLGRSSSQQVFAGGGTLAIKGRIENVIGTDSDDWIKGNSANNVLVGGDGNDRLDAGAGRDLLIGGEGSDTLLGGSGDDILIGGTTAYDDNTLALAAIMREWTSARSFRKRRDNLAAGINDPRAGLIQLDKGTTVRDDGVRDALFGGPGQDWFFDFLPDVVHER